MNRLRLSLTMILAFTPAACGGGGDSSGPPALASVTVSPPSGTIAPNGTMQLSAVPKDANGNALSGRVITWTSSNNQVASVNATGLVSGLADGISQITATVEGVSGSASITV